MGEAAKDEFDEMVQALYERADGDGLVLRDRRLLRNAGLAITRLLLRLYPEKYRGIVSEPTATYEHDGSHMSVRDPFHFGPSDLTKGVGT